MMRCFFRLDTTLGNTVSALESDVNLLRLAAPNKMYHSYAAIVVHHCTIPPFMIKPSPKKVGTRSDNPLSLHVSLLLPLPHTSRPLHPPSLFASSSSSLHTHTRHTRKIDLHTIGVRGPLLLKNRAQTCRDVRTDSCWTTFVPNKIFTHRHYGKHKHLN